MQEAGANFNDFLSPVAVPGPENRKRVPPYQNLTIPQQYNVCTNEGNLP